MTAAIKNTLIFFLIVFESCFAFNSDKQNIEIFYGTWIVEHYKFGNAISAIDETQASRYINKKVIIKHNYAMIFDNKCSSPSYKIRKEEKRKLLYDLHESELTLIKIDTDSFITNEVDCNKKALINNADSLGFGGYLVMLSKNKIMIPYGGAYFFLKKEE